MCGICAVFGENAYLITKALLTKINHRGQDGIGLFLYPAEPNLIKGEGLVNEVLKDTDEFNSARIAIGQVRYPTEGAIILENVQPIVKTIDNITYIVAHNGEIIGYRDLVKQWNLEDQILSYCSDTHIIPFAIARAQGENLEEKIINGLNNLNPSWSLCMAISEQNHQPLLVFAKDHYGIRPLSITKNHLGIFALSENSLPSNNSQYIRELENGEIIIISNADVKSYRLPQKKLSACIFEHVYFHFPKGEFANIDVAAARHKLGKQLAIEEKEQNLTIQDATVVYAPDSSHIAAVGYASEANLPLRPGIIRRHYQSNPRGFMARPDKRASLLEAKYEAVPYYIKDKKIILEDDSIVRGNASKYLVNLLRNSGAKEVHVRIPSPRIEYPCTYGVAHKTYGELIAHRLSTEDIRKHIGADSLLYLSLQGMHKAIGLYQGKSCNACFSGDYPFKI